MRVALVNSWYIAPGGVQWVDNVFGTIFPEADVFTLFSNDSYMPESLRARPVTRSFLHSIPMMGRCYRLFTPLCPYAIESLDVRGYDLVLSSDHGVAKGILCDQGTVHVCYCHTPWRQLYDLYQPSLDLVPRPLRHAYGIACHGLRQWDYIAAQRVDYFVANSKYIQHRIQKCYRRTSEVIYPPVDTSKGYISNSHDEYYLSVGRLTHTKRLDLLIEACNTLGRRLIIAGEGREEARLKAIARPTVEFLGRVPDQALPALYANCRAVLFAADEDFGIVPVEAQAFGRPVIAYGHGGVLETVRVNDPSGMSDTGKFFREQSVSSLIDAIREFETDEHKYIPEQIRVHSHMFDTAVFVDKIRALAERVLRN